VSIFLLNTSQNKKRFYIFVCIYVVLMDGIDKNKAI
jgi:hypothetical protein